MPPTVLPRRLATLAKPGARPKPVAKKKAQKKTCCDDPEIVDDPEGGRTVCANCGAQISESNIVSDVTFQEGANGAMGVQGGFVGEKARHANTLGSGAFRRIGGGERNARM